MSRNEEAYAVVDTIDVPRSHWNRNWTHKTAFNAGKLVPFYVDGDIIPGTTIKNRTSVVIRMNTPLYPIMDNLYLDTYYFKCSKYWYWEHFRAQHGENNTSAWTQTVEYITPTIKLGNASTTYGPNDLANYLGIPQKVKNFEYDRWAVSAYIDVWNNWFRSEALTAPISIDTSDNDLTADGTINTGYGLLDVCKFFDYFTSALPQPQKQTAVSSPIGTIAPVIGNGMSLGLMGSNGITPTGALVGLCQGPGSPTGTDALYALSDAYGKNVGAGTNMGTNLASATSSMGVTSDSTKSGLIADLSNAVAATINAQRLAFATQRIFEKDARFGSRYPELLKGQFGTTASDEALLIPEYLGGKRIPINIEQITQTSSTDNVSPLGETGAFSVTVDVNEDFTKSFTKHDIIIGVMCVRADHTYQQGLPKQFTRPRRLDTYYPSLAHIGNQPINNEEIYLTGTSTDKQTFGFKEAWQEYLYKPSMISGEMNSEATNSLDNWHFGDDYASLPVLSDAWIKEPTTFIDRCLAVPSSTAQQFWSDIYIEQDVAAPIPINRVPGLIDHY